MFALRRTDDRAEKELLFWNQHQEGLEKLRSKLEEGTGFYRKMVESAIICEAMPMELERRMWDVLMDHLKR